MSNNVEEMQMDMAPDEAGGVPDGGVVFDANGEILMYDGEPQAADGIGGNGNADIIHGHMINHIPNDFEDPDDEFPDADGGEAAAVGTIPADLGAQDAIKSIALGGGACLLAGLPYSLGQEPMVENPTLDIDAYANAYTGMAKLQRLFYVSDHCQALRVDTLKLCLNYLHTSTSNYNAYQGVFKRLQATLETQERTTGRRAEASIGQLDTRWVDEKSKKVAAKLEKLDTDLKNYKSNSIKESIRRGHDDLGDHYLEVGDLNNALKCYSRARDYCTSSKNLLNMCWNVIRASVYLQNWSHVLTYVAKAEGIAEYDKNSALASKLTCAAGLAELSMKRYSAAAKRFLAANFDNLTPEFSSLISPNNVAIYGGLTALATFDRNTLRKSVISSPAFKLFLELEPQIREAINHFYASQYAQSLSLLAELKDNLLLDLYLAPHVNRLYEMIRSRALIQYFSPYMSADMNRMAAAFNTTVPALEEEVVQLILDGQIQARIDSHNKIIYAKDVDKRPATFDRAIAMGREWQRSARTMLLRGAIHKNGSIMVRNPNQSLHDASMAPFIGFEPGSSSGSMFDRHIEHMFE